MQTKPTGNCTALSPGYRRPGQDPAPRSHWTGLTGPVSEGRSAPTGHPHPLARHPPPSTRPSAHILTHYNSCREELVLQGTTRCGICKVQSTQSLDVIWGRGKVGTWEGPWEPSRNRARLSTLPDTCRTPVSVTPQGAPSHHLTVTSQELRARHCGSRRQYETLNTLLPADTPELLLHAQVL